MTSVIVVIGAGQIGQAIARRVGVGKHVLLADLRPDNAAAAAEVLAKFGLRGQRRHDRRVLARRRTRTTASYVE